MSDEIPAVALKELSEATHPAVLLNRKYRIVASNEAHSRDVAGDRDVVGMHCFKVSHGYDRPCDQSGETCPLKAATASRDKERVLHVHLNPRGREFVDVEIEPILDAEDRPQFFLEHLRPTMIASAEPSPAGLVGNSSSFNQLMEQVQRVAREETSVLLMGETGTGKELIARAIHEGSKRAEMPFVPVECSGPTETLFESEMFGHRKGAFTGAHDSKPGLVELANSGTLFLDEIGELSAQLQVKLLRLIETRTLRRVGDIESMRVDFRLICATNRDLWAMVQKGGFRDDLYYRLNTYPIVLPPLRERKEDIGILAQSLLDRDASGVKLTLSEDALRYLEEYSFPGNVRELDNLLKRARLQTGGDTLRLKHFPDLRAQIDGAAQSPPGEAVSNDFRITGIQPLDMIEELYLSHVLRIFKGKRTELAELLGISRRTLTRKIGELKRRS